MRGTPEEGQHVLAELGSRICELRSARGWSRAELASRLGLSKDRVAKWEQGVHGPHVPQLLTLGQVLRVSYDELLTGCPRPTSEDRSSSGGRIKEPISPAP
jgi:transcriptional regulator with XRE-family HTH domain